MATFAVIHGAGGRGSDWRLVAAELEARGHTTVPVDLPCEDPVGIDAYAGAVIEAVGDQTHDLVLVAHSLGGLTAPVVASRIPVAAMVLVTAMVPLPGERGSEWWTNVGHEAAFEAQGLDDQSEEGVYLQDVSPEVVVSFDPPRDQTGEMLDDPNPIEQWPDVPTTYVVCTADRFFPGEWMTGVVRGRLGIEPVPLDAGHCPYWSRPAALAEILDQAWTDRERTPPVALGPSPR